MKIILIIMVFVFASPLISLADDSADVDTTYGNSADVNTVYGNSADANVGYGNSADVNTIYGNSNDVNLGYGNSADVNTTYGNFADVGSVYGNSADVNTIYGNSADVNSVYGNSADVNSVYGNSADVNSVYGNSADVNSVYGNSADINTTYGNSADVNTTYGNTNTYSNYSGGYAYGGSGYYSYYPWTNYYGYGTRTYGQPVKYGQTTTYTFPQTQYVAGTSYYGYPSSSYYYSEPTPAQNQVLSYTDTSPKLDSVYLSDVPYTGLADSLPLIIFISSLVLWSGILAYVFLKRKITSQSVFAKAYISESQIQNETPDNSVTSSLMDQIATDKADISKVEEYARMNKVLLSSDAVEKIVKLARFGKINASQCIKSFAKGEWLAIGEKDIK